MCSPLCAIFNWACDKTWSISRFLINVCLNNGSNIFRFEFFRVWTHWTKPNLMIVYFLVRFCFDFGVFGISRNCSLFSCNSISSSISFWKTSSVFSSFKKRFRASVNRFLPKRFQKYPTENYEHPTVICFQINLRVLL